MTDGVAEAFRRRPGADAQSNGSVPEAAGSRIDGQIAARIDPASPKSPQRHGVGLATATAAAVLPEWMNTVAMIGLIFGGCCSNVFALEAIVKEAPGSGTLITCFQFLLIAVFTLPSHLDFSQGIKNLYLKPRAIPFTTWLKYTALFLTINVLNNKAFGYKISVPLHIILRSAGPVATMAVGFFAGKRYSVTQIAAVLMLFIGVVQAAIADAMAKSVGIRMAESRTRSTSEFVTGFSILFLALMLSAVLGIFTDRTYAKYGREHSEENLFYSHALFLPFFFSRLPKLRAQAVALFNSPSSTMFISQKAQSQLPDVVRSLIQKTPIQVLYLFLNGLTQYLCIRGVNQLSAQSSSLTVGIVLNIRKLISLLLSIWLFGNRLESGVLIGAAIVFIGGALYAMPAQKKGPSTRKDVSKKEL